MNLNKLIAAVLSLSFVAGATTNINNYAPHYSVKANAEVDTAIVTTIAATTTTVTTTKAVATTTTKADVTTVSTTKAAATTTKAAVTTTVKAPVTSTTAAVTKTAKSATSTTSVVTSITSSTTTPVAKDIISGDVNNDGRIDAIDASTILAHYALISTNKKGILTEAQIKSADINNDGVVNAVDASTVLAIYAANSVKAVKPSVQNNPIHDFSMDYNIDLTSPTWEYCEKDPVTKEMVYYCDKFGGDYKMDEFFPNEKELKEKFEQDKFGNLSDYRCVATIVLNPKKDENIVGTREVTLYHVFVDNDITELKGQWTNENDKKGIYFNPTYLKTFCYKRSHIYNYDKNHVITSESESDEWSLSSINSVTQGYAIYTNIPIVINEGTEKDGTKKDDTVLTPNKEVPLEKIKNVQLIDDSGAKSIKLDNYSSYSKTFTVPDWYDIDLRNPAWEPYEEVKDKDSEIKKKIFYCDKFGGDFKMDKIFPSDELLNNALSLKDGGRDKYKCVATIVHNSSHSRGVYNHQMSLEHFFVKTDDFKDNDIVLKGYWDDSTKKSFRIANITYECYLCGNSIERNRDNDGGWKSSSVNIGVGSGSAIYTNVPIIMNDGTIIEPYFMYGDINDDGVIDIEDARMIVDFLNGDIELPDDRARKAADANRDGVVDEKDITALEEHINGKKPINDSNIINNDNDSDSDGLTDLEEYKLGTNRFNPDTDGDGLTDKEEKDKGTKPLNPDTDGDYLNDGIDPDPLTVQPIQIDDSTLNDNVDWAGWDVIESDYPTDGRLGTIRVGEGSKYKNYYEFVRKVNYNFEFVIEPTKNSDYEITMSDSSMDAYFIRVYEIDEKGNERKEIEPYSITIDNKTLISKLSLESGKKYIIRMLNYNDCDKGEFAVRISQDNWVYAPHGGAVNQYTDDSMPIYMVYLPEDTVKDWIWLDNLEKKINNSQLYTVEEGEEHYRQYIADEMYHKFYKEVYEDINVMDKIGDFASITGLLLLPFGEAESVIAIISGGATLLGGVPVLLTALTEPSSDLLKGYANNFKETAEISATTAIRQHHYSFCISGYLISNEGYYSILASSCTYWQDYYFNKYYNGERYAVEVFEKMTTGSLK
ncbi:MAG: hypothetical protein IKW96_14060 [Ruminococcus sp.]|uniref:dockerin type I domain-containing protein n=1 Tax=Ruminococcus sp. TaxID=41978 RepID=UPI0025DECDF8|nr:dockerin type I domain-containing protein [Ruminococcus sp.]MBR5684375.1 hypothetical protein [Ruminococcus sp.]